MEELEKIVQRMIDAGESEENIAKVIREYNKSNQIKDSEPVKKTPVETDATAGEEIASDTELTSEDGSLGLSVKNKEKLESYIDELAQPKRKEDEVLKEITYSDLPRSYNELNENQIASLQEQAASVLIAPTQAEINLKAIEL